MAETAAGPGSPADERDDEPDMEPRLSIGQTAARTGLSVHTLRFYEREGLFASPVHRASGGRRRYSEWDVEWLDVCTRLRASGMPLSAIRDYACLVREGDGNEEERLKLLRAHRQQVQAQIADLTECLGLITYKIRLYEDSLVRGSTDPLLTPEPPRIGPRAD